MEPTVLTNEPGLLLPEWLDGVEKIWPELADVASAHRDKATAFRNAQAAASSAIRRFEAEDKKRIEALAEGRDVETTPHEDRQHSLRELKIAVDAAELGLQLICETAIETIRAEEGELSARLDAVRVRADQRIAAARQEMLEAEEEAARVRPAAFWLKRTIAGNAHTPIAHFGVPSVAEKDLFLGDVLISMREGMGS